MVARASYKRIKKDYQHKNLHNPFFYKKSQRDNPRHRRWLLILIALVLLAAVWFFFAAPFWRIKIIEVSGLTRLNAVELQQVVWNETHNRRGVLFSELNIILFRKEPVSKNILESYNFAGAEIIKKWPDTLELKVIERPYAFILQEGSVYYYASADAYIIKEPAVTEEDKGKYFILENKNSGTMIAASDKINIEDDYLNFILDLNRRLAVYPELPVEKFIIDQEFNTVKVKFADGPTVFFSIKEEAAAQITRLLLVKKEKIKDNFSKTNYIDLRYGDKIFINPDFN